MARLISFLHFLNQSTACLTASISKQMEEETPSPQAHRLWKSLKTKTEDNKVRKRRKHAKGQKLASTVLSLALFLLPLALAALLSQQLWFLYSTSLAPFLQSTNGPSGLHPTYQASTLNELESERKKKPLLLPPFGRGFSVRILPSLVRGFCGHSCPFGSRFCQRFVARFISHLRELE